MAMPVLVVAVLVLVVIAWAEPGHDADQDSGPDRGHDRASVQPTVAPDDDLRDRVQPARPAGALAGEQLAHAGTCVGVVDSAGRCKVQAFFLPVHRKEIQPPGLKVVSVPSWLKALYLIAESNLALHG